MLWDLFKREPKPFDEGYMSERDGHAIYYYQYGNPQGIPVLSFHGGPGGSSRPKYAKMFNLKKYRFIQFDQRGCGMSQFNDLFYRNETSNTILDALRLLEYLKIETRLILHGASWGSTLTLLFAEAQPQMISNIVISSIFLARPEDYGWVNKESERFYPDLWHEMRQQVRRNDIYKEYHNLMFSPRIKDNLKALSYLGSYEYQLGQLAPHLCELEEASPEQIKSAQIAFYYDQNEYFISRNQILENSAKIKDIPTLIYHNRMDFCCPVKQAWDLHQALPKSELTILPDYGHSTPHLLKEMSKKLRNWL
ncbi:MAG: alpha/beta fold hydrolase [Alphaproteobacteria bacterium]|nr:alpha/beta fold hydrolase [Alphaproteobacteria bacterium]